MKYPKFILKEDWIIENNFLGKKTNKKIYEKGEIFEPTKDGFYKIIDINGNEDMFPFSSMEQSDIFNIIEDEIELQIEEISSDDDTLVSNWRIQLDVKTTRKGLSKIEKAIQKHIRPLL